LSPPNSNEVLIKRDVIPRLNNGVLEYFGTGKKTVDAWETEKRFSNLGIKVDWKKMKMINDIRNEIEHYCTQVTNRQLSQVITDTMLVIRDFITEELDEDPKDLLGDECWQKMLDVANVFLKELKHCRDGLASISCPTVELHNALVDYECPGCASKLICPEETGSDFDSTEIQCRACGATFSAYLKLDDIVQQAYDSMNYMQIVDGGEPDVVTCPYCDHDSFVNEFGKCVYCAEELGNVECLRCSEILTLEEQAFGNMCSYCTHVMSK